MVVVGGPHPTVLGEDVLRDEINFDIVVTREGELTMLELAQGRPLDEIEGIIYRHEGAMRRNKNRALIEDLDGIPMPDREILKKNAYTRKVFGDRATSIVSSRGCPFSCAFCCKDVFGYQVRFRSPANLENEIKEIIKTYGITNFLFYDDTFTLKIDRLRDICGRLSKLGIIFRCNGNARTNTYEDYVMLYNAGCREIAFGIESGSQKILDNINKEVTVEQNERAIKDAKRAGLLTKAYLMIGSPGETRGTVEETIKFIEEADPDQFTLFNFIPLPGCDVWKNPEKYKVKIVSKDFKQYFNIAGYNKGGLVAETEDLTMDDIGQLRAKVIDFLNKRGQRGALQDYYKKLI
jgi:radical SAM superfamily enzyme YgiQ (UPF0313 family)